MRAVYGVFHKNGDQGQAHTGCNETGYPRHAQIVFVRAVRLDIRFPDIVDEYCTDRIDQRVGGAHERRGQGRKHESEDARCTKEMGSLDEGVAGVGDQFAVIDQCFGDPSAATGGDRRQRGQQEYPADDHPARIFDALEREESHNETLVHEHNRSGIGQAVLNVNADEAEFGRCGEIRKGELMTLGEQRPEIAEAAEVVNRASEEAQACDK